MFLAAEFQGIPSNTWGINMRPLLLQVSLWNKQVSEWVSALILGSSASLAVDGYGDQEPSFMAGKFSVQILALPLLSE